VKQRRYATSAHLPLPGKRGKALIVVLALIVLLLESACGLQTVNQPTAVTPPLPPPPSTPGAALTPLSYLRLPAGFQATAFTSGLQGSRFITFSPDGTLLVAERGSGRILAFPDPQHNGQTTGPVVVASDLNDPTSLDFGRDGSLYVGEASRVTRFTLGPDLKATSKQVIVPHLPTGGNHVTRTVLIGPDNRLYVSIGSTCNDCVESDPMRASVWVYNIDGSGGRLYARGLRNAVGMAINPWNQQIWVTDMGRDLLGDNTPPETVYALQDGSDYGWPVCHAGAIIDPDLGHTGDCNGIAQPLVKMQAHSAPLGLAFYNASGASAFPPAYRGLFIAFHGSWNRSVPTGYKVIFVPLNAQGQVAGAPQDFATGWLNNQSQVLGRPVGLAVGPDGSLYVSDDLNGVIYRITYTG
jgi:glucose/arabinose dehydrogenase